LFHSAELLDERLCLKVIQEISTDNPKLGDKLKQMVENFEYQGILSAIESINPK